MSSASTRPRFSDYLSPRTYTSRLNHDFWIVLTTRQRLEIKFFFEGFEGGWSFAPSSARRFHMTRIRRPMAKNSVCGRSATKVRNLNIGKRVFVNYAEDWILCLSGFRSRHVANRPISTENCLAETPTSDTRKEPSLEITELVHRLLLGINLSGFFGCPAGWLRGASRWDISMDAFGTVAARAARLCDY